MAREGSRRIAEIIARKNPKSAGRTGDNDRISENCSDLASDLNASGGARGFNKKSEIFFLSFDTLVDLSGLDSIEDFAFGLLSGSLQSSRVITRSATTDYEADWVFNNQTTKTVRGTRDIKIAHWVEIE